MTTTDNLPHHFRTLTRDLQIASHSENAVNC